MHKSLVFTLLLTTALAQAKPPAIGGISERQMRTLRTLGRPIYVPTHLPAGFHLDQVTTTMADHREGYTLTYRGPDNSGSFSGEIEVEMVTGEIGSVGSRDTQIPFTHPTMGKSIVDWNDKGHEGVTEWLAAQKDKGPFYHVTGENLKDGKDLARVAESLRPAR